MGFDRKDIQVCARNVLNFSGRAFLTCVKKYPFLSCILFLFFFLYMFFPAAFSVLIYSIPLVGFAALVHRVFLDIDRQKTACLKDDWTFHKKHGSVVEDDHVLTRNSGARRRNAKRDTDEKLARASVEDKDVVSSASFNDDLVDKSALVEGNPKETQEVKAGSVTDKLGKGSSSSSASKKYGNNGKGEEWGRSFDNSEEEDDDEEEAREEAERNEAVEWTEDDQKNLMDLGLSEIERNKRLESLIARRRSRKLLSFQVRKTVEVNNFIGENIPSLQIPKMTNLFLAESSSSNLLSPGPGSAPSVLLPMRNPFDLPYDPLEEKPNLTGDSFHQEFMAAHQKEMMYCRHESFITKGAFLPPERLNADKHETSFYNGFASTKHRTIVRPDNSTMHYMEDDDEEDTMETVSPISIGSHALVRKKGGDDQVHHQEDDQDGNSEAGQTRKEMVVPDVTSGRSSSSSSSSSDRSKPPMSLISANKDAILRSLSFTARRKEIPSENDNISEDLMDGNPSKHVDDNDSTIRAGQVHADDFFYTRHNKLGCGHTPSHSIASDLQVEVSEVGSPPLTNISSQDEEESSSINDADGEIIDKYGTNIVAAYAGDHDEETSDHLSTGLVLDENNNESLTDADPLVGPAEIVEDDATLDLIPSLSPALPVDSFREADGFGPEFDTTHEIIQSPPKVPILTGNVQEVTDELVANESHHDDSGNKEEPLCTPMEEFSRESTTLDNHDNDPEAYSQINESQNLIKAVTEVPVEPTHNKNTMDYLSVVSDHHDDIPSIKSIENGGDSDHQIRCHENINMAESYDYKPSQEEKNVSEDDLLLLDEASTSNNLSQKDSEPDVISQMSVSSSAQNETNITSMPDSRKISEVGRALSDQRDIEQETSDSELLASNLSDRHFIPQVELSDSISESSRDHHTAPSEEPGLPTQFQFGAEQLVPTIISNSPKSVLQPEFSLDGASLSNFSREIQTLQAQQSDIIRIGDGDSTSRPENLTQAAPLDVVQFLDDNPVEERDLSNDSTSQPENLTQVAPLDVVQFLDDNPVEERDLSNDSTSQPENLTQVAPLDVVQFLDDNPVEERDLSNDSTSQPENLTQVAPLDVVQFLDDNPVEERDLSNDSTSQPENLTQAAPLEVVQYLDVNPVEERDLSNSQEPPSHPVGETKEESTDTHPPIQASITESSIGVHPSDPDRPATEMSGTVESTSILPPPPGMLIQEESIATSPPLDMSAAKEPITIPPPTATSTTEESTTIHPPLDTSTMEES